MTDHLSGDMDYVQELFEKDPPVVMSLSLLVFDGGDPFVYGVNTPEGDEAIVDQITDLWVTYWERKKS